MLDCHFAARKNEYTVNSLSPGAGHAMPSSWVIRRNNSATSLQAIGGRGGKIT